MHLTESFSLMKRGVRMQRCMKRAKDLLAVLACACLVLSMVPAVALAADDDAVTGTVDCGDGWSLAYSITDDEATITGIDAQPAEVTDLTIPDTVGDADAPVTTIGTYAFAECTVLAAVGLPANLVGIEERAFFASTVTSITLPVGFEYIQGYAFTNCKSLKTLTFAEGCHPEYFSSYAFSNCTALEKLEMPYFTGTKYEAIWSGSGRLAASSFYGCTGLETVTFLAGSDEGLSCYGNTSSAFEACGSVTYIVYAKSSSLNFFSAEEGNVYYAVNFYQSREDAEADTTAEKPWEQILLSTGTYFTDLAVGNFGTHGYTGEETMPDMPEASREAGMVWGISDHVLAMACNYLTSTVDVYPVSPEDMDYTYVTSPEIEAYYAESINGEYAGRPQNHNNSHYQRMRSDGTVDLSDLVVKTAEGTVVDSGAYTFSLEKQTSGGTGGQDAHFEPIDSIDEVDEEGTYRVQACGVGDYEGTQTAKTEFHVLRYDGDVYTFASTSTTQNLGNIVKTAVDTKNATDRFAVLAPADRWQYSLIATALAGAGESIAVYTNGSATSDTTFQTLLNYSHMTYVGPISAFGSDVIDRVKTIAGDDDGAYNYFDYADYETLSLEVYETIHKYGPRDENPYDWNDTAIVCSQSGCFDTALISQYAYQAKAPIFFTAANGSLGTKTREALAAGEFDKIIIAGDTDYVSASVAADIESATGIAPQRLLENGESACAESITFTEALQEGFADEAGVPANSTESVVVTSVTDPASVFAATELAALTDGIVLQCASSADVKEAEGYLLQDGQSGTDKIKSLYVCGDYSDFDTAVTERLQSIWEVTPQDMTVGTGDTVEQGAVLYKITSNTAVTANKLLDANRTALDIKTVSCSAGSYSVTALAAGAFSGATSLKTVSLPGSITSISSKAFYGCTALSSISTAATQAGSSAFQNCRALKSAPSSLRSVGASAFQGCTALTSVPAQATSIGASAFQGCTALKSVSCASAKTIGASAFAGCTSLSSVKLAKVTSIPSSAFSGDKKLKSATFGAVKTIGASAFLGCAALTSAPTTKATTIGASAFSGCSSLKSIKASSAKKIGASAFQGCKKLKKANLTSKKLKSIGKSAFSGDKKLKKVTIKSKKLKKVGTKAFKGVGKKATIKVPKAKVKKYTKLLTKAGLPKKANVTA